MSAVKTAQSITEKSGWSPLRDGSIFFRQDQLFHINHLSQTVRRETGTRYKFATPDEIMTLLEVASKSNNKQIRQSFENTVNTLSDELKTFLGV